MILRKTWQRHIRNGPVYEYTGWFLLGVIPVYIERVMVRR